MPKNVFLYLVSPYKKEEIGEEYLKKGIQSVICVKMFWRIEVSPGMGKIKFCRFADW